MNRNSKFSLTIMVIVMALLAIFVGYLLGNWLIQMVTGDQTDTHQAVQERIVEEETVEDSEAEDTDGESSLDIEDFEDVEDTEDKEDETGNNNSINDQLKGDVYVVQVGAFRNYENAVELKNELEKEGYQVIITEDPPYKVQLGATTSRAEAEQTEKEVEAIGYDAFITH